MVEMVRAKLSTVWDDCTVVFQLFDNSFYMARTEEGGLILAVKEATAGRKYHIHGELVFAPKELQYSVFNTVKPVLDAAASFQKIVISPLPRYLHTGPARKVRGISQIWMMWTSNPTWRRQSSPVGAISRTLPSGRASSQSGQCVPGLKKIKDNLWPSDPVHMSERGYSALADLVLAAVQQNGGLDLNPNNSGRGGRNSSGDGSRGPGACGGGGRLDATPSGVTPPG